MKKKHFVVLGAGISGLSLGWYLHSKFGKSIDLTIIEKSPRVGGWIQTIEKNGFLFELGPHSCRAQGNQNATLRLVNELNIQDQILFADSSAKKRYLLHNQQLRSLPTNPLNFLFSPMMKGALKALWQEYRKPINSFDDESIYQFICRRFNANIAEQLVDPLVSGIYAGDMRKLSLKSCFPTLYDYEHKHGSVVKGMLKSRNTNSENMQQGIFSFRDGMETLPRELEKKLEKFLRKSSEVKQLKIGKNEEIKLSLSNGELIEADYLYSTLSPNAFAKILSDKYSFLMRELHQFSCASVCVVNLGYDCNVLKRKGFGYLVPSIEQEEILGVIWDSNVFPPQNRNVNQTRLTVMLGGSKNAELCHLSCDQQLEIALEAIERHMGINAQPKAMHVSVARESIPQYLVGHQSALQKLRETVNKVSRRIEILGSSYDGVSLNDCIAQAEKCVEALGESNVYSF